MKNLDILINELTLWSSIGPKQGQRLAIEFIKNKKETLNKLNKLSNLINEIKLCNICNLFYEGEECSNCKLEEQVLYIIENFNDYFKIYNYLQNQDLKFFNLNFNKKSDYLNNIFLNNIILRLTKLLQDNENVTKISFFTPPSLESELIIKVFKKELKKIFNDRKFLFTKIKIGVPKDLSISYLNIDTIQYIFNNQEEI
ncbi:recombination protein RecR [Candidatus Hepatoplasma crinochetorum Av]|jgi:recombinational DNA repair protein RecR|uniref:Recombination protein RecR n=1 Tax=Candidatus Hepatoplasma crinochetorum Av TaxID=1427984 RepID=W8GKB6_9MOLU|nr:hypothetical protein [Candidatus Hepatoplasma crinochetorum]AHK22697.1 recombination protein RecR [Candidatus Hepatoplasma crinochetorum Av]